MAICSQLLFNITKSKTISGAGQVQRRYFLRARLSTARGTSRASFDAIHNINFPTFVKYPNSTFTIVFLLLSCLFFQCSQKKTELLWSKSIYQIGSQSSPRATDLNEDGILDIVMGAGLEEMAPTEHGVLAFDGSNGELLWQQKASAHIVGSPTFYDITKDGIDDVFIGGRNHNLMALNGKTGALIWQYNFQYEDDPILKYARFNFYNSVLTPDQNNDGTPDLLTVNGGNWDAPAHSNEDRFSGVLMLFDLKNGAIIAADTMPDGKESYMSPIVFQQPNSQDVNILFGTGGETAGGHLYLTKVSALKSKQLNTAKIIASEDTHGFIAPPVVVDLTSDGIYDIVTVSHATTISAIDGESLKTIWQQKFSGMESSNGFAVGQFTDDEVPDLFTTMSKGTWPIYSIGRQVMINGQSGTIEYEEELGCFSLSSPVAYDADGDEQDEVILSVNKFDCSFKQTEAILSPDKISNQLVMLNFKNQEPLVLNEVNNFKNMYSTPWIGDMDQDDYLDIIYCQYFNPGDLNRMLGLQIRRISTAIPIEKSVLWGEYMGANGHGIFPL